MGILQNYYDRNDVAQKTEMDSLCEKATLKVLNLTLTTSLREITVDEEIAVPHLTPTTTLSTLSITLKS